MACSVRQDGIWTGGHRPSPTYQLDNQNQQIEIHASAALITFRIVSSLSMRAPLATSSTYLAAPADTSTEFWDTTGSGRPARCGGFLSSQGAETP